MERKYSFVLHSKSGYKFSGVYMVRQIERNGQPINIEGSLYIGNPKTNKKSDACVTITVNYPESIEEYERRHGMKSSIDPSIAHIILIKYYAKCADNRDLINGEGTVEMVTSAMSFIKQICPFVKEFDLKDSSYKMCDNNSPISLPYYYIATKGKTWYEGKFGAYLKPKSAYDEYKKMIQKMMSMKLEELEIFKIRYWKRTPEEVRKMMEAEYLKSDSMGDFLGKMHTKYGQNMMCLILQSWIEDYMRAIQMDKYIVYSHWYIAAKDVPLYSFTNKNKTWKRKKISQNTRKNVWNNNSP
jgi:hypothetical protein